MKLVLARIAGTLRLPTTTTDPFALYGIRTEFTNALRRIACNDSLRECHACETHNSCSYLSTLSQELSSDPFARRLHQKPPLPFVFDFPRLDADLIAENRVEFVLSVFGGATGYLGDYLQALGSIFTQGSKYGVLEKLESLDIWGGRTPISLPDGRDPAGVTLIAASELAETMVLNGEKMEISLETPMVLPVDGAPLREFDPCRFLRTLIRRVSSLAYYCGGEELACDYKDLSLASHNIRTVESSISWTIWRGNKLAGLTGNALLEGDLAPFLLFLSVGVYAHLGKGASFGLGRYTLR